MGPGKLTARLSPLNPAYYCIYLNGRLWRVCHTSNLAHRWPGIAIEAGA